MSWEVVGPGSSSIRPRRRDLYRWDGPPYLIYPWYAMLQPRQSPGGLINWAVFTSPMVWIPPGTNPGGLPQGVYDSSRIRPIRAPIS